MKFLLNILVFQLLSNVFISNSYIIMNVSPKKYDNQKTSNKTRRSMLTTLYRAQWDNGIIPYEIEDVFSGSQRRIIQQAAREWEKSTCLKFVHRSQKKHPNYVKFSKEPCGCCSYVGNQRIGTQETSFDDKCLTFGSALHELGHVIGFLHEHSRPDRNNYVKIYTNTISNDSMIDFVRYFESEVFVFGYYDYNSIMHYANNTDNGIIIEPIKKINGTLPQIGQRSYLSELDIAGVNSFYNCPKCGDTFFGNYGNFSPPSNPHDLSGGFVYCQWTIRAAQGERIKLEIESLNIYNSTNCTVEFLEIRNGYQIDAPVLARHCGKVEAATIIANNYLIVTLVSSFSKSELGFSIEYVILCGGDIYVDFLKAREGINDNAPIIGTYCGKAENLAIISLMRRINLKFLSNGSKQAGGFSAAISAIPI